MKLMRKSNVQTTRLPGSSSLIGSRESLQTSLEEEKGESSDSITTDEEIENIEEED